MLSERSNTTAGRAAIDVIVSKLTVTEPACHHVAPDRSQRIGQLVSTMSGTPIVGFTRLGGDDGQLIWR